jgi:hypothetical protein
MRAIESKAEVEQRRRRNQWIIGTIMIVVMMGSTFGYAFYQLKNKDDGSTDRIEYKGYTFVNQNEFWTTTIGNYNFAFVYNPTQVENIPTSGLSYLNSYSGKPLYIFSEDYTAKIEVYRNLGNIIQRAQDACPQKTNCTEDWPTKDCSNNFIIIKEANESRIYQNESCVFIEGKVGNLTQITDEFLFKITGIES